MGLKPKDVVASQLAVPYKSLPTRERVLSARFFVAMDPCKRVVSRAQGDMHPFDAKHRSAHWAFVEPATLRTGTRTCWGVSALCHHPQLHYPEVLVRLVQHLVRGRDHRQSACLHSLVRQPTLLPMGLRSPQDASDWGRLTLQRGSPRAPREQALTKVGIRKARAQHRESRVRGDTAMKGLRLRQLQPTS